MEFTTLVELFETLSPLKRKYRIVGNYIKYLKSITEEKDQIKEVESFKKFLLSNKSLGERIFTNPIIKAHKDDIYTDNITNFLTPEQLDVFWESLMQTERIMFPKGRPVVEPQQSTAENQPSLLDSEEARKIMESDPLLADVMTKVLESGALSSITENQPVDVTAVLSDPKFMALAKNITGSLTSGTYNEDSLGNTIDTISSLVGDDVDPEIKNIITFLKKSIKDIKSKKPVDMAMLTKMILSMNTGGVDVAPLMSQLMNMNKN